MICVSYQILSGDEIVKNEMSGTYSTMGKREMRAGFWWGNMKEKEALGKT
jgi:hypothetical protein